MDDQKVSPQLPYRYICIEGNIGTGKTTFCQKMSRLYSTDLLLEQFNDNNFLPMFYVDPKRYAFPVEIFFMTERYKQIQNHFSYPNLFMDHVVSDYFFPKTMLFAKNSLNNEEFRIFKQLYDVLEKPIPHPDLLVYLHRSVPKLQEQIMMRDRDIEKNISDDYLLDIQNAYFEYFRSEIAFPILVIDVENMDFKTNDKEFIQILNLMSEKYTAGVHRISIS